MREAAIRRYQDRARHMLERMALVRARLIGRLTIFFVLQLILCAGVSSVALVLALDGIGRADQVTGDFIQSVRHALTQTDRSILEFVGAQVVNSATFDASKLVIGDSETESRLGSVFAYLHRLILGFALPSFIIFIAVRVPMVLTSPLDEKLRWEADASPEELIDKWRSERRLSLMSVFHRLVGRPSRP